MKQVMFHLLLSEYDRKTNTMEWEQKEWSYSIRRVILYFCRELLCQYRFLLHYAVNKRNSLELWSKKWKNEEWKNLKCYRVKILSMLAGKTVIALIVRTETIVYLCSVGITFLFAVSHGMFCFLHMRSF